MKYLFLLPLLCFAQPRLDLVTQEDELRIVFSEPMDTSIFVLQNYKLYMMSTTSLPAGNVPHVTDIGRSSGDKDTIIVYTTPLAPGVYRLDVNDVYDLAGNLIDPAHKSIAFIKDEAGLRIIQNNKKME